MGILGDDLIEVKGTFGGLVLSSASVCSRSRRLGGKGGSFAWFKAGGSFLAESTEEALVFVDPA